MVMLKLGTTKYRIDGSPNNTYTHEEFHDEVENGAEGGNITASTKPL